MYFSVIVSQGLSQGELLTHLRENLHRTLDSLTTDSADVTGAQSVPRVPEICFMSDDSSPESMSSWLDHKFTADTASPLLRCESCKLLVHASELLMIRPCSHIYIDWYLSSIYMRCRPSNLSWDQVLFSCTFFYGWAEWRERATCSHQM